MQNKKTDLELEKLIEAVKKRGVKCQICGYIPKYREEFQLVLVNDKLTCNKCKDKNEYCLSFCVLQCSTCEPVALFSKTL